MVAALFYVDGAYPCRTDFRCGSLEMGTAKVDREGRLSNHDPAFLHAGRHCARRLRNVAISLARAFQQVLAGRVGPAGRSLLPMGADNPRRGQVYKAKAKHIPGFGIAVGLLIWLFTHLAESAQQIIEYISVGAVIAALVWGMWKFRAHQD